MRCNNCGWDNPLGVTTCQKCNQALDVSSHLSDNFNFDPRSTMADVQRTAVDPRSTMADIQRTAVDPRSTMADVQRTAVDPRSTMADVQRPTANPRATLVDVPSSTIVYHLNCMDSTIKYEIEIHATQTLGLCPGDVIMIKDKRYQVL